MGPDVVAHSLPQGPQRMSPAAIVFLGVVIVLVVIWALESVAATLGYGPTPDPTLTLAVSGVIGALATVGLRR